jgi:hypothetical protein|eukprot:COSAG01_NODE_1241_length_11085_cov_9.712361_13_plen_75_part_00
MVWARTGEAYTLTLVARTAARHGFRIIVGTTESRNIDPYACHVHAWVRRQVRSAYSLAISGWPWRPSLLSHLLY